MGVQALLGVWQLADLASSWIVWQRGTYPPPAAPAAANLPAPLRARLPPLALPPPPCLPPCLPPSSAGRYIILLMSIFSIYTGFIYNEMFSVGELVQSCGWLRRGESMLGAKGL